MTPLTAIKYRIAQYDAFRDHAICQNLSKRIVKEKIGSQIRFLELTESSEVKEGISQMHRYLSQTNHVNHEKIEAGSSRTYFREFSKIIPSKYAFESVLEQPNEMLVM